MPVLANELLLEIFPRPRCPRDLVEGSCSDYQTLSACNLVCKQWAKVAQPLIFHTVILHRRDIEAARSPLKFQLFFRQLRALTRHKRALLDAVRVLVISFATTAKDGPRNTIMVHKPDLADVAVTIGSLPNLQRLEMVLNCAAHMGFDLDGMRRLRAVRRVEQLSVVGENPAALAEQFLGLWPSIRHLELCSVLNLDFSDGRAPQPVLESLIINSSASNVLGRYLTGVDVRALRLIRSPRTNEAEAIDTFAATLEEVCVESPTAEIVQSLTRCAKLKRVIVGAQAMVPRERGSVYWDVYMGRNMGRPDFDKVQAEGLKALCSARLIDLTIVEPS